MNKKRILKVAFRVTSIVFLSLCLMFFTGIGNFNPASLGFYWAIFAATVIIFSNDYLLPKLLKWMAPKLEKTINFTPSDGEAVSFNKAATPFKGWEGVGGKLFLTSKRLVFKSHKLNIQNHEEEFDLDKILNIHASNEKRLSFEYKGKKEKFALHKPEQWADRLKSAFNQK